MQTITRLVLSKQALLARRHGGEKRPGHAPRLKSLLGRRSFSIALAAGGLACIAGYFSSGAGATTQAHTAKPTGVLTFGVPGAPTSLNPALDNYSKASLMRFLSNEPILELNPNGSFSPGLATSWKYVGKGDRVFQFTLRKDARFSDGTPVTASAVKTWLTYFAKAKGGYASDLSIGSIATPTKWTVRLNLSAPSSSVAFFMATLNWGFVSGPRSVADPASLATSTDGAGPYVLLPSETLAGDHYTFVPNKYYYDQGAIKYSKVILKVIATPSSMLAALQAGQLNVAIGDPTTAAAASSAGLNIFYAPSGTDGLFFTDRSGTIPNDKPIADVRVRQALNYALNRAAITTGLLGKYGTTTSELTVLDASAPKFQNYYPYDPTKAKQLLAAAGYPNGFTLPVVDLGIEGNLGDPLTQAIAQNLSAIGVTLQITTISTIATFVTDITNGSYPAFLNNNDDSPISETYGSYLAPKSFINPGSWSDPVLNKLAAQAEAALPPAAAKDWSQLIARTVTQADFVPVFEYSNFLYAAKNMSGISMSKNLIFTPAMLKWVMK